MSVVWHMVRRVVRRMVWHMVRRVVRRMVWHMVWHMVHNMVRHMVRVMWHMVRVMMVPRVTVMMPPVPADRSAPAYAGMEIFTAPVPTAVMPAFIVPTVTVAGIHIIFGLSAGGAGGTTQPSLRVQLGTLRHHERRSLSYGAVDGDA